VRARGRGRVAGLAVLGLLGLAVACGGCGDGAGDATAKAPGVRETAATPTTLAKVYGSAKGGAVIRLAPGAYGAFTGGQKSATVTVRGPVHGTATMSVQLTGPQRLVIDHVTVTDAYLNGVQDVTIRRSTFTGQARVDATLRRAGILLSHNHFGAIDPCAECFEGRLTVKGDDHPDGVPVGITIRDNRFGPGGAADGVQIIGTPYGVRIGPGNRFSGLGQSQAQNAPHTDPIQLYGSTHTVITGNLITGNATGIMAPDGSDHETITDNVIQTTGYPWPIVMGGAHGNRIQHNTLPGGGSVEVGLSNAGDPSVDVLVQDNVMRSVVDAKGGAATGVTQDYNLVLAGRVGPHDLRGRPRYRGGAQPRSFAGFRLAHSSAGRGRGSASSDIGIGAPRR
jgi:hypothetical protein